MTTKPRKVWTVTSGAYSDFRVEAIFETEADAKVAVANGFGEDVNEMTLYPAGSRPQKRIEWRVWATVGDKPENDQEPYDRLGIEWNLIDSKRAPKRPRVDQRKTGLGVTVTAWSSDREAALKAVSDRYAQPKAEREGL